MDKRLRSALATSASSLLSVAASEPLTKRLKFALRSLITSSKSPNLSSLPSSLHSSVALSLDAFKNSLHEETAAGGGCAREEQSPPTPPTKRPRRSSRHKPRSPPLPPLQVNSSESETLSHLKKLQIYALAAQYCLSHPRKLFAASDLLPAVQLLHDSLLLYEMDPALLSVVSALCEEWWKEKLPGRETLISQSLPYLLSKSLENGKKTDVHRVYALREAFTLFDFVDESIDDLRLLLVRCVITPLYLKADDGRRFITFTLGLSLQLLKEVLALMRSQIPFGRKSVLEAYGEILFRAWKCSEDCHRGEIEDGFLQGLIDGAVHTSSRSLAISIRRVLCRFLEQRATEGVDRLLYRLAEPVLFRSLQVANSNVRLNSLHLLIDMFPLEDPDANREVKNALIEKEFFLLEKLMFDDCPDIRAVCVEGISRILNLFWEVIPSPIITKILSKMMDKTPHDVCYEVRLSLVNGLVYMLGNPQTHEILKMLLPRLGGLFLDPVLSVRVAITDLLLAVTDMRSLQYSTIVDLDNLLSSLANDHPHVAKKLTRLLIPSYFPSQKPVSEACSRCIALLKRSPSACARLCEFASLEGSPSRYLLELFRTFANMALSLKNLSPDQIDGLFSACANICHSLSNEASCRVAVTELISKDNIKSLLNVATTVRSKTSLLGIASIISPAELTGFREHCLALTTNCQGLSDNQDLQKEIRTSHKLIFSCGWSNDLLGILTNVFEVVASRFSVLFDLEFPNCNPSLSNKKKIKLPNRVSAKLDHSTRKANLYFEMSSVVEDYALAAAAAWQLKDLLVSADTRNAILVLIPESTLFALKLISQVCIDHGMHQNLLDISPVLAYLHLSLQMSLHATSTNLGSGSNHDSRCRDSSIEKICLNKSLRHIITCAEKLFSKTDSSTSSSSFSGLNQETKSAHCQKSVKKDDPLKSMDDANICADYKDDSNEAIMASNLVKLVTALLMFVSDAATTRLVLFDESIYAEFILTYAKHITSLVKKVEHRSFLSNEESFMCIRSSFSYAAKILHLMLSSPTKSSSSPHKPYYLSNCLLDLVTSIELYLGSRFAIRIISIIKPWLPDIILGFCSAYLDQAGQVLESDGDFPLWITTLSKIQLDEVSEISVNKQNDSFIEFDAPILKELMDMVVSLLKNGNLKILDAVCFTFSMNLKTGIKKGAFDFVLGLVHFMHVKLLDTEGSWMKLERIKSSLQELHLLIENTLTDTRLSNDSIHLLMLSKEALGHVIQEQ